MTQDNYEIHPDQPRWTHVALRVTDVDSTIEWYTKNAYMSLLFRREDEMSRTAWLGQNDNIEKPFVLVVAEFKTGKDPFDNQPYARLRPFAHFGIEMPSLESLKEAEKKIKAQKSLTTPITKMPSPIGVIFIAEDPDGNMVEFSYDQGLYSTVRQVWGELAP